MELDKDTHLVILEAVERLCQSMERMDMTLGEIRDQLIEIAKEISYK